MQLTVINTDEYHRAACNIELVIGIHFAWSMTID